MRVFVTGATGFIGSAVVQELLAAGHQVVGLARSDESAKALDAAGAQAQRGSLDDLQSLRRGAAEADGVIHCAFIHDFTNYSAAAQADKVAIETMGAALAHSDKPLVVTAGLLGLSADRPATEEDSPSPDVPRFSEPAALEFATQGVRVSVVRLPPSVHGAGDHGFVPYLIGVAREKGTSAYIDDGANYWSAVHRLDAAHLFRLALERGRAGAKYHGIGDEGVPTREIAQTIGRHLNLPVSSKSRAEAPEHFGWIAPFFGMNARASSAITREQLGWEPTHPCLLADLENANSSYFGPR